MCIDMIVCVDVCIGINVCVYICIFYQIFFIPIFRFIRVSRDKGRQETEAVSSLDRYTSKAKMRAVKRQAERRGREESSLRGDDSES